MHERRADFLQNPPPPPLLVQTNVGRVHAASEALLGYQQRAAVREEVEEKPTVSSMH